MVGACVARSWRQLGWLLGLCLYPMACLGQVIDGDTLIWNGHRWRLSSIDTPERGEPFNKSASKRLAELASDGLSCHQLPEPLTHGRHVGYCEAGGKDVAMVLVREGLAAVCHNRSRAKDYAGAEREAMAAKRGIWSRGDYQRKRYCPA